jgi:hypothetical protein
VADNVTINNLLPYRIDTGRQQFLAERASFISGQPIAICGLRARLAAVGEILFQEPFPSRRRVSLRKH